MAKNRMKRGYRSTTKPFAIRMVELVRALQLIRDSLVLLRSTNHLRHLVPLSGQLRALLIDKSGEPLLLKIAEELGKSLSLYCMPDVNDPEFPESLRDKLEIHLGGFPITPFRQLPKQISISFSAMLDQQIIHIRGNQYTVKDLINWYANNAGGAHYAPNVPEDLAALLYDPTTALPLSNYLIQLGDATLDAGRRLIKQLIDIELHALLVVPIQPASAIGSQNFILDSIYPGTSMRVGLLLNKLLKPVFFVSSLQGVSTHVECDRIIDWTKPRYVRASMRIEDDLSTVLDLLVDGERVGRTRVDDVFFVDSSPSGYERFHNRAHNGQPQLFSFGLSELVVFGAELAPKDNANMILWMLAPTEDPNLITTLYSPNSYGHASPGTSAIMMTGDVRSRRAQDVLGVSNSKSYTNANRYRRPSRILVLRHSEWTMPRFRPLHYRNAKVQESPAMSFASRWLSVLSFRSHLSRNNGNRAGGRRD